MITAGAPAASFLATCGSDPIEAASPFGGRHGTRLKMSLADFASSFALSMAFSVRLFCNDGAAGVAFEGAAAPSGGFCGAAVAPDGAACAGAPRAPCSATEMSTNSATNRSLLPARTQRDNSINQNPSFAAADQDGRRQ